MSSTRKILAIIPARGGSKGVPGKNIKPLAGIPLLAHTIIHARNSSSVNRIVVSTDDEKIAETAGKWDAEVIVRPQEISGDTASSESALVHVLETLKERDNYVPDLIVFLQATSAIRSENDIENALKKLEEEKADSLLSVSPMHGFLWRDDGKGFSSFSYDHKNRPRRQDAPKDLIENGSFYIFKPEILLETGNRLGGKITYYEQGLFESFQIDETQDFELVEALLQRINRQKDTGYDLAKIKLLVFDFDGVMTDNKVYVSEDGKETVAADRGDGWGVGKLRSKGLDMAIISTEINPVVTARAKKLKLECHQNCPDKLTLIMQVAKEKGLQPEQIAYVGNDENDLEAMRWVGLPIAVANAEKSIFPFAKIVTNRNGGDGAVREICEMFYAAL
jgi:YrbI family 3-deoxy-D-manno-octulosonate 8-phosphate phosphatase